MLVITRGLGTCVGVALDRVERDQLSRPERCPGDDAEPLIGQDHIIWPLIGPI